MLHKACRTTGWVVLFVPEMQYLNFCSVSGVAGSSTLGDLFFTSVGAQWRTKRAIFVCRMLESPEDFGQVKLKATAQPGAPEQLIFSCYSHHVSSFCHHHSCPCRCRQQQLLSCSGAPGCPAAGCGSSGCGSSSKSSGSSRSCCGGRGSCHHSSCNCCPCWVQDCPG